MGYEWKTEGKNYTVPLQCCSKLRKKNNKKPYLTRLILILKNFYFTPAVTANCVNGTADGILWEGDNEESCLYWAEDSILCFVNCRLLANKSTHCQLPTQKTPWIVLT
jgi:hypothetical protein